MVRTYLRVYVSSASSKTEKLKDFVHGLVEPYLEYVYITSS